MVMKRSKILKTILTEIVGFNSKSISNSFFNLGLVFLGALLGGIVFKLENPGIIILLFFGLAIGFKIFTNRQRGLELIKEFLYSSK